MTTLHRLIDEASRLFYARRFVHDPAGVPMLRHLESWDGDDETLVYRFTNALDDLIAADPDYDALTLNDAINEILASGGADLRVKDVQAGGSLTEVVTEFAVKAIDAYVRTTNPAIAAEESARASEIPDA